MKSPQPDHQYDEYQYQLSEGEHAYGKNFHLVRDPFALTQLAKLCSEKTEQPWINELVTQIYRNLITTVINREFPLKSSQVRTRMITSHPEGVYQGPIVDPETKVVSVNLARAGTLPSHLCYSLLNYILNPEKVRQDHISIARVTDASDHVTGNAMSGHKIGGPVDDQIVIIPDPMAATGSTIVETLNLYKTLGKAKKYIALHCIVTPEYLRKVFQTHPDVIVYAIRLDRGLSPSEILKTPLGSQWDREKGLNDQHYIVPGGGGFGEILNNAFV